MPMTDTDRLATPSDLVDILKRLTTILREVEARPETAQQRFWDDLHMPAEDLRIGAEVGLRTVTVLYNILNVMCGPRLAELVNGEVKEYYERMLTEMQMMQPREWEGFLDQKFEAAKGTEHEGSLAVTVAIHSVRDIGRGCLSRVDSAPKLLKLVHADGKKRYFAIKDIVMLEFDKEL